MSSKTVTYFVVIKVSCLVHCFVLGKVRFLLGGGGVEGGPGLRRGGNLVPSHFLREKPWGRGWRGGSLVIFFYKLGGVKPVLFSTEGGSQFSLARKNYSMSLLFCIYKQSYQSRLI